jgi:hypothetical protein
LKLENIVVENGKEHTLNKPSSGVLLKLD